MTIPDFFRFVDTGLAAIVNLSDRSHSIAPEVVYAGTTNLELRARLYL